jgi:hypothetical protein
MVALAVTLALVAPVDAKSKRETVRIVGKTLVPITYTVNRPGITSTTGQSDATCRAHVLTGQVYCSGGSSGTTITLPPSSGSYTVVGADLLLVLADGRVVTASCRDKKRQWGSSYRDCRVPDGDTVDAEFKGKDVKLRWSVPVGLDGSKSVDETYEITSVTK